VNPDIAFGMPFRILRAADQRFEFRIVLNPSTLAQKGQSARRSGAEQDELFPLSEDPLACEALGLEVFAHCDGLRCNLEVKAGGELHPSEHPKSVLRELLRAVAKNSPAQITEPPKGVDQFASERVKGDRVDAKVTAGGGLLWCQGRVAERLALTVLKRWSRRAARDRDVDRQASNLDYTKSSSDEFHTESFRQDVAQVLALDTVNLEVKILCWKT
jgi:hypothetical protein